MNNIFENAKFGDRFLTKDGREAIFVYKHPSGYFLFIVEDCVNIEEYYSNGQFHNYTSGSNSGWNIVSTYNSKNKIKTLWGSLKRKIYSKMLNLVISF